MDLDALREAVEDWVQEYVWLQVTLEPLETVVAAARAVLDSEEAWWCETHGASGTVAPAAPGRGVSGSCPALDIRPESLSICSMVPVAVVRHWLLAKEK